MNLWMTRKLLREIHDIEVRLGPYGEEFVYEHQCLHLQAEGVTPAEFAHYLKLFGDLGLLGTI